MKYNCLIFKSANTKATEQQTSAITSNTIALKANSIAKLDAGVSDQMLINACNGLTTAEQIEMLTLAGVNEEKIRSVLLTQGLTNEQIEAEIQTYKNVTANQQLSKSQQVLTKGSKMLKTALKGILIGAAISAVTWGIGKIVESIDYLIHREEKIVEKANEAKESLQSLTKDFANDADNINKLADSYAKLSDGVDKVTGKNLSLSSDDYEEYLSVNKQIVDLLPDLTSYTDSYGNKIVNLSEYTTTLTNNNKSLADSYEEIMLAKYRADKYEDVEDDYKDIFSGYSVKQKDIANDFNNYLKDIKNIESEYSGYNNLGDIIFGHTGARGYFGLTSQLDEIQKYFGFDNEDDLKKITLEQINEFTEYYYNKVLESINKLGKEELSEPIINMLTFDEDDTYRKLDKNLQLSIQKMLQNFDYTGYNMEIDDMGYYNSIKSILIDPISNLPQEIKERFSTDLNGLFSIDDLTTESYNKIKKSISEIYDTINSSSEYKIDYSFLFKDIDTLEETFNNSLQNLYKKSGTGELSKLYAFTKNFTIAQKELWEQVTVGCTNATQAINKFASTSATVKKSFSDIYSDISGFEKVSQALTEQKENGMLPLSTISELIESYSELEDYVIYTADGYKIEENALENLIEAKRELYQLDLDNAKKNASIIAEANGIKTVSSDMSTDAIIREMEAKLSQLKVEKYAAQVALDLAMSTSSGILSKFSNASMILGAGFYGNQNKKNKEQASLISEQISSIETVINSLRNAQDNYDSYTKMLSVFTSEVGGSGSSSDAWLDAFNKKYDALKHELAMEYITEKEYYSQLDALNNEYFKGKAKYLSEYNQYLEEVYNGQKQLEEDAKSAVEDLRDTIADMIRQEKEDMIDALEEELDALNKILDARKEALDLAREQNDYEKDLAEKNKSVADIEAELLERQYDDSAESKRKKLELQEELKQAQEDLDEFLADHAYDTQIEEIEKEKEANENAYDDKIKQIQDFLDNESIVLQAALDKMKIMNFSLYQQLIEWNSQYGTGIQQDIVDKWNLAKTALQDYSNLLKNVNGVVNSTTPSSISSTKKSSTSNNKSSNTKSLNQPTTPNKATVTVQRGDTLWDYAIKYYGDGTKWTKIQAANAGVDPYRLQIGSKIIIPYKNGSKSIEENQLALIDELGEELVVRAGNSGNITALTKGSGVIPSDLTANLMEWGKISPINIQSAIPNLSYIGNSRPELSIGDIYINGDSGKLTTNDLNKFRKDIVDSVFDKMQSTKYKFGMK